MSQIDIDPRFMVKIEACCVKRLDDAGFELVDLVRSSFGDISPSPPGHPPAYKSGGLSASIDSERSGRLEVVVGPTVEYGSALEYGTAKMAARPFMRPALRRFLRRFVACFEGCVR